MGLDMYLMTRAKNKYAVENSELNYNEIGYWRKANAIHKWFVDNVQQGKDECQVSNVSRDQLQKLLEVVNTVLNNQSKATELLPPQKGFFFGSQEIDEWYFKDLKDTKVFVENALKLDENWDIFYQSSW